MAGVLSCSWHSGNIKINNFKKMFNKKFLFIGLALFVLSGLLFSGNALAQTIVFDNPLRSNTVEDVLGNLLNILQGIIVTIAIIFIIIAAILYMTSAGDEGKTTSAKRALTAAMIGLAIGIAAPSFLREIADILGWGGAVPAALSAAEIALNVVDFLLSIVGIIGVIMLVVGGIMYLTSTGDEGKIETAKKISLYAVVGIVVALAAIVIVKQVAEFFV